MGLQNNKPKQIPFLDPLAMDLQAEIGKKHQKLAELKLRGNEISLSGTGSFRNMRSHQTSNCKRADADITESDSAQQMRPWPCGT